MLRRAFVSECEVTLSMTTTYTVQGNGCSGILLIRFEVWVEVTRLLTTWICCYKGMGDDS